MAGWVTVTQLRAVAAPDDDTADDRSSYNDLSDAQLQVCCDDATAEVRARLAPQFTLPDTATPSALLVQITAAVAAWQAYLILNISQPVNTASDPVYLRYQWALGMIAGVLKGTVTLPDQAGTPETPGGQVSISNPAVGVGVRPYEVGLGPLPWNGWGQPSPYGWYPTGANTGGQW